ncbi:hypothetical protein BJX76DRAFT_55822 [Aspergillus varians]
MFNRLVKHIIILYLGYCSALPGTRRLVVLVGLPDWIWPFFFLSFFLISNPATRSLKAMVAFVTSIIVGEIKKPLRTRLLTLRSQDSVEDFKIRGMSHTDHIAWATNPKPRCSFLIWSGVMIWIQSAGNIRASPERDCQCREPEIRLRRCSR